MINERSARRALILITLARPCVGRGCHSRLDVATAGWIWTAATVPVVIALAVSIVRDLMAGRMGVDAIALLAMGAAIGLDQSLAAIVVAIMYTGGTVLEDYAVARAERNLKSLVDRAPRLAHRRVGEVVEDVAINDVKIGDAILVRAGEIIPVDGLITSPVAVVDEVGAHGRADPGHAPGGGERPQRHAQRGRHV